MRKYGICALVLLLLACVGWRGPQVSAAVAEYNIGDSLLKGLPVENVTVSSGTVGGFSKLDVLYDGYFTVSGLSGSRWAVESNPNGAYIEFNLGKVATVDKIAMVSGYPYASVDLRGHLVDILGGGTERLTKPALSYYNGAEWVDIPIQDTDLTAEFVTLRFVNAVETNRIRITSMQDTNFRVREIAIYPPGKEFVIGDSAYSPEFPLSITIDGADLKLGDVKADRDLERGVTYLPIRVLRPYFGFTLRYDDPHDRAIVEHGNDRIEFTLGKTEALVNGEARPLAGAPYLRGSYVYVPVRQFAEFLGGGVTWIDEKTQIQIYTGPYLRNLWKTDRGESPYEVTINGEPVQVFCAANSDFAQYTCTETVEVAVAYNGAVRNVTVRPQSKAVETRVENNVVYFQANPEDYLSVEINDDLKRPLFLFFNTPIERPDPSDPNVIFLDQGPRYKFETVHLREGQTLYLGDNVVLEAPIRAESVDNIRIIGNGIIYQISMGVPCVHLSECNNVEINGIVTMGSNNGVSTAWNSRWLNCDGIRASNIKVVTAEVYSDGIDVCGSSNVEVDHVFIRNDDDGLCIKVGVAYPSMENITFTRGVIWSGEGGNAMEIGYDMKGYGSIKNVVFRDMDVIHRQTGAGKFNRGAMTIHHPGNCDVSDVLYEDIRVESSDENLVVLEYLFDPDWSSSDTPWMTGTISNVTYRNVTLLGGPDCPSWLYTTMRGLNADIYRDNTGKTFAKPMKNIVFENLNYKGTIVDSRALAVEKGFLIDDGGLVDVTFRRGE